MLLRMTFILLSVAVLTQAAGAKRAKVETANCGKYSLPACTREYDPVCGSDGKTYSNECMFCLEMEQTKSISITKKGRC